MRRRYAADEDGVMRDRRYFSAGCSNVCSECEENYVPWNYEELKCEKCREAEEEREDE